MWLSTASKRGLIRVSLADASLANDKRKTFKLHFSVLGSVLSQTLALRLYVLYKLVFALIR